MGELMLFGVLLDSSRTLAVVVVRDLRGRDLPPPAFASLLDRPDVRRAPVS